MILVGSFMAVLYIAIVSVALPSSAQGVDATSESLGGIRGEPRQRRIPDVLETGVPASEPPETRAPSGKSA